jgi:hypothetical protein
MVLAKKSNAQMRQRTLLMRIARGNGTSATLTGGSMDAAGSLVVPSVIGGLGWCLRYFRRRLFGTKFEVPTN